MQETLSRGGEREKEYDWLGATEFYQIATSLVAEHDSLLEGEIYERMGYAFFRAATQAERTSEFRARCGKAVECYEEARDSYDELDSLVRKGRVLRCKSMIAYLRYWLASELSERRRLVELSWRLTKESLKMFAEAGEGYEYGRTYNQLCISACFQFVLQADNDVRKTTIRDAVGCGRQAIAFLSSSASTWELAVAYAKIALFLAWLGHYFLDVDERLRRTQDSLGCWLKAMSVCEEAALNGLLNFVPGAPLEFWGIGTDGAVENLRRGLEYVRRTKDRFAIGCALDWLAFNLFWKAMASEDPNETLRLHEEALKCAQDARRQYMPISFTSPRGYSFPIELADAVYWLELSSREVNVWKRRRFLDVAEKIARHGLRRYEDAGYPFTILGGHHELGKVLLSLARMEQDTARRKALLEEALDHRTQVVKDIRHFLPFHYFDQGFMIGFLVSTKRELAELAECDEARASILKEAVAEKENSVKLGIKYLSFFEKAGSTPLVADVCRWQLEYGDLLSRLYSLTKNKNCLKREVEVLQNAARAFEKLGLMSRAAECLWKIAQTHEALGEDLEAVRDFDAASSYYFKAARKMPQLGDFYQDKSFYMQAWSEIEKARHFHRKQEYGKASRHFEKAAGLHKMLKQWHYLAPNYSAWAKIERAEEVSRKERCEEAIQAFEQAATLFREARKSAKKRLGKVENEEEKQMVADLLKASDLRQEYCMGRISIENARTLGKKGERYASAREYGSATELFDSIAMALESEEDIRELRFIAGLSRAWQRMALAEDRDMPTLYAESAQLFEKASEHGSGNKARFLALGHSRFCRALEAGTRFLDTQEMAAYSTAMQCLQSATRYYKMAGLKNDVEHAKATELIFEAYVYVNNAKREVDPEKKAKLYKLAEVIFQASSVRYMRAKRPEKRNEVLRLLKTVREEREWALSCAYVLRMRPLVSAAYFPAPIPTSERSVGLSRFEHADVQAYLSVPGEALVGDELSIRLDLVNIANNPGLLIRVDQLIPPGLRVVGLDPQLSMEDGLLDLKGKKLEPLKVESIKISAQAVQPGPITLSPKVIFVDDAGRFKTSKPKPVRVTVNPRRSFEFKVKSAEDVLSFLAASFWEDYEKRKMSLDSCGWRSLVEIMKRGKVPRSSVYKAGGGRGQAIVELERRGLIEARVSSGERGRGGNILRLRICYQKEDIKKYVDQQRSILKEK